MQLDATTEQGQRVLARLQQDEIVWLTTVGDKDQPLPSPVWFLWNDGHFLIFSQPNVPKVRNIAHRAQVALNLNSNPHGGDVVIFAATATILAGHPGADEVAAYVAKYSGPIAQLGMNPDSFAAEYSVALHVTPTRLRVY